MFHFAVYNYQSVPSLPVSPPWDSNWLLMIYFCIVFCYICFYFHMHLVMAWSELQSLNPSFTDVNTLLFYKKSSWLVGSFFSFLLDLWLKCIGLGFCSGVQWISWLTKHQWSLVVKCAPISQAAVGSMVEVCTQALMLPEGYPHSGFQWKSLRQSKQKVSNTFLGHFTILKLQVGFFIREISTSESLLD